jgi:putative FmdB family regulatory protein
VDPLRDPNLRGLARIIRADRIAPAGSVCHHSAAVPTYDYQCRSCGSTTEVIHSMLEDGPSVCERCGGELRRVLYPTGIIFKGSGFYRNDSRDAATSSMPAKAPAKESAPVADAKPKPSSAEGTTKGSSGSET